MPVNKLSSIAVALVCAGLPLSALAEQPQQTDKVIERLKVTGQKQEGYRSSEADGATKLGLSLKETPQAVTVITREQIEDFGLDDINSVLESSAAVNVENVETDRVYYTSRGFELNNFQIDGLGLPLINNNTHGRIDTALYERVEVIHGANGIMTGVGSPSATVNMVRKRPTSETHLEVDASLASWNGKRLQLDASGKLSDRVRARVVAAADNSESYIDRYENDTKVFYGVADFAVSDSTLLTVGHSEHRSHTDGNMWGALTLYYGDGTPTNFDESTNVAADWSEWGVDESRSFIDVETALSDNWTLRAAYNRVRTDEDSLLFYTYLMDAQAGLDPETGLGLLGYGSEYDLDDEQDTLDVYASGSFTAWGQLHELVVGANYARLDYVDHSLYDFHTGLGFPVMPSLKDWDGNTPLPEFTDGAAGSVIDNTQKAVYAQARLSLSNQAKLLIGGRYNDFTTDGVGYGVDQSRDDAQFIPYLGLTYAVNDALTAYASYTETFLAQTERDRDFRRIDPLTGKNSEIGLKTDLFDNKALLNLAYFHIDQENLAVSDGEAINPETGVPEPVYRAADGINSQGLELELSGQLAEGLQGMVSATVFDIDGDQLVEDYTAEKLFRTALTYQLPQMPAVKLGLTYQWQDDISREQGVVGPMYDNAGDVIVTKQPSYGLLGLMASWQINDALSVRVNGYNVTDEKYLNSLYWAQGFYGAPANYSATLSYSF
ncbi:TonB-dependent siderophore receptor [Idiomarina sp. OT37-5b]|uniref:TonB-dependent siderophore receptor n=1 Tax=Idiomarina aquatica TaxID=1327752 RepID=A0AA94JEI6_9GAMM|nr:TonB-dependent siderophore receptor [Idiomarina sp. OT37-5b]RUO45798.1 TonB-dependent siderophore receptor [Idiomarina aquatica]